MAAHQIIAKGRDAAGIALGIAILGAGFVGWVLNAGALFRVSSGWEFAVRLFGIPMWPIGAIIGWL